jgi:hypothetical protein
MPLRTFPNLNKNPKQTPNQKRNPKQGRLQTSYPIEVPNICCKIPTQIWFPAHPKEGSTICAKKPPQKASQKRTKNNTENLPQKTDLNTIIFKQSLSSIAVTIRSG